MYAMRDGGLEALELSPEYISPQLSLLLYDRRKLLSKYTLRQTILTAYVIIMTLNSPQRFARVRYYLYHYIIITSARRHVDNDIMCVGIGARVCWVGGLVGGWVGRALGSSTYRVPFS